MKKTPISCIMVLSYLFLIFFANLSLACADQPVMQEGVRKITVIGYGKTLTTPDTGFLNLSVSTEGKTPEEAFQKNKEVIKNVIHAIKQYGVEERDIQTSNISIYPNYEYPTSEEKTLPPVTSSYQIINALSVRISDISKVNDVMEKAFSLGVNQGGNVTFFTQDLRKISEAGRKKALDDAMQKAKNLAESANVHLGHIIQITEIQLENNITQSQLPSSEGSTKTQENVPVQTGQNIYEVQLKVEYALQ